MHSKKLALALFATLAMASAHAVTGVAEVGATHGNMSISGLNTHSHSASFLVDHGKHKLGAGVTSRDAWGERASVLDLRAVTPLGQSFSADTRASFSNSGVFAAHHSFGSTLTLALPKGSVGVGAERVELRGGADAWVLKAEGSHKLHVLSQPVTLSADVAHSDDAFGTGSASRVGVGASTDIGKYSLTARHDHGRLPANLAHLSPADGAVKSTRTGLSVRTWVRPTWGVEVGATHVDHKVYHSNEVRAGVFWKL